MIDIRIESGLITFAQAAEILEVSRSTVRRYALIGFKGRKLDCVRVGGVWRTSRDAVHRFIYGDAPRRAAVVPPGVIEELRQHGCSR